MTVYQIVEVGVRDLSSRLLTSLHCSANGIPSLVTSLPEFLQLDRYFKFSPGVFHDKSITPSSSRLSLFSSLKRRGFFLTSIDEENGLLDSSYARFASNRFSPASLELVDEIFCWGSHDYLSLRSLYPSYESKFCLTGSPRVDLWLDKSNTPYSMPFHSNYIFIPSNFGCNSSEFPHETIAKLKTLGYFQRDVGALRRYFESRSDSFKLCYAFIELIESISARFPNQNIVVRPHPNEAISAWQTYLSHLDNVFIIHSGSISEWISNASLVIHNGCTSALEASVSKVPLLTYRPLRGLTSEREVPNLLGSISYDLDSALEFVDAVLQSTDGSNEAPLSDLVLSRIHRPNSSSSSQLIAERWISAHLRNSFSSSVFGNSVLASMILKSVRTAKFVLRDADSLSYRKFPGMSRIHFFNLCAMLSRHLDMPVPKIRYLSPRCFYFEPLS